MERQIDKVGRITIPIEFRNKLDLNIGDYSSVELIGNKIIITKPNDNGNVTDELLTLLEEVKDENVKKILKVLIEH